MSMTRRFWLCITLLSVFVASPAALAQEATPQSRWEDFLHYVRVARPDLAGASASALLTDVDDETLLDVVESNVMYRDWETTLERAKQIDTLAEVARQLSDRPGA